MMTTEAKKVALGAGRRIYVLEIAANVEAKEFVSADSLLDSYAAERVAEAQEFDADFVNDVKLLNDFALHEEPGCGDKPIGTPCSCGLHEVQQRLYAAMETYHKLAAQAGKEKVK
jgi:hypothetical protein